MRQFKIATESFCRDSCLFRVGAESDYLQPNKMDKEYNSRENISDGERIYILLSPSRKIL